jgi:hypothetical protein
VILAILLLTTSLESSTTYSKVKAFSPMQIKVNLMFRFNKLRPYGKLYSPKHKNKIQIKQADKFSMVQNYSNLES